MYSIDIDENNINYKLLKDKPPLTKEINCIVCDKPTTVRLKGLILAYGRIESFGYGKYCINCDKKIKAVNWYAHHRKEPTLKQLDKEVKKYIKELGG